MININQNQRIIFWITFLLVSSIVLGYATNLNEPKKSTFSEKLKEQQEQEFIGKIKRYSQNVENARECAIEECESQKNRALKKYRDCRNDYFLNSHAQCIDFTGHNFEKYSCTGDKVFENMDKWDFPHTCMEKLNTEYASIKYHQDNLIDNFISTLPPSQSILTNYDLFNLFETFPVEVLSMKYQSMIKDELKQKGYKIESID